MGLILSLDNSIGSFNKSGFVGLLDQYTGAAAGYSLRQLSVNTTNVVRVRRSSDNAEADFTADEITDGTLLSWVGNTASDNGFVTTWYDQSGNGNNATQATAANQPKIVDSGVLVEENGKPAVDFDGVDDGLRKTSFDGAEFVSGSSFGISVSSYRGSSVDLFNTIWHVGGVEDSQTSLIVNGYNKSTNKIHAGKYKSGYLFNPFNNVITENQYLNIIDYSDSLSFELYTNSLSSVGNTNPTADVSPNVITIGAGGSGNNHFLDGKIQEIIFYDTDQSSNRVSIETNINNHYNIYP